MLGPDSNVHSAIRPRARRVLGIVGICTAVLAIGGGGTAFGAGVGIDRSASSTTLIPGERAVVVARLAQGDYCRLTLSSTRGVDGASPLRRATSGLATFTWRVPRNLAQGRWIATVRCGASRAAVQRSKGTSARTILKVQRTGTAHGRKAAGSIAVTFVRTNVTAGGKGAGGKFDYGYCTWGAWQAAQWLGSSVSGHAKNWLPTAQRSGLPTGRTPVVGAVFVRTDGDFGHVGVVSEVINATTFRTHEMNGGTYVNKAAGKTVNFGKYHSVVRNTGPNMWFIYRPGTEPGAQQPTAPAAPAPTPAPPVPAPAPRPSTPAAPPTSPTPVVRGFTIEDSYLGGTWARTDPNNGAWYSKGNRPGNGAYWYPNGLGVGVDCARTAAPYTVTIAGRKETWNTWFHVTDGKWYPSAASRGVNVNGLQGLPGC